MIVSLQYCFTSSERLQRYSLSFSSRPLCDHHIFSVFTFFNIQRPFLLFYLWSNEKQEKINVIFIYWFHIQMSTHICIFYNYVYVPMSATCECGCCRGQKRALAHGNWSHRRLWTAGTGAGHWTWISYERNFSLLSPPPLSLQSLSFLHWYRPTVHSDILFLLEDLYNF